MRLTDTGTASPYQKTMQQSPPPYGTGSSSTALKLPPATRATPPAPACAPAPAATTTSASSANSLMSIEILGVELFPSQPAEGRGLRVLRLAAREVQPHGRRLLARESHVASPDRERKAGLHSAHNPRVGREVVPEDDGAERVAFDLAHDRPRREPSALDARPRRVDESARLTATG